MTVALLSCADYGSSASKLVSCLEFQTLEIRTGRPGFTKQNVIHLSGSEPYYEFLLACLLVQGFKKHKQVGPTPESNSILKCIWGPKKCWVEKIRVKQL